MFIGGAWTPGTGEAFASRNPATGEVLAELREASTSEVDAAVDAAADAFRAGPWPAMSPSARAALLWRVADLIERDAQELAGLETRDQGQPLAISAGFSIPNLVEHFRYYAGWATKITGLTSTLSVPDVDYRTRREPLGVCALITPWNFPLPILGWKLAPALATGNTVVIKPAEQTTLSTLRLVELLHEAGVPDGVVNVVTGGPQVGKALTAHPDVVKISFTGSTTVGREIAAEAGRALKKVSLELGGKAPSIVAGDADIDSVIEPNALGGLLNSGQICAAFTRLYVDRKRVDEFTTKLAMVASRLPVGPGDDPQVLIGPLVSQEHRESVEQYIRTGTDEGAQLVTGGGRKDGPLANGYFLEPTVLGGVTQGMRVAREEIFGPVLTVLAYEDRDELAALANDSEYGLAAAIWSRDIGTANGLANRIKAGTVWINMAPAQDAAAAWGGMKASGLGREMGWAGIEAYTQVKSIWTSLK
jgi:aldehyde dehydrogenase (NAD+)/betaine-aldehyde dehydrogenase